MSAAFTAAIVAAGVFGSHELPHGATRVGQDVYFVLYAPHAVRASLVLLSTQNVRSLVPMQPTTDNRYWWCRLPEAQVPVGQRYRFLQNDDVEVLDPATRWAVNPAMELWANVGEGDGRAWSLFVDRDALRAPLAADAWRTLPWESLIIYELHPLRFTVRNANVNDGLDQVAAELAPGRYLRNLGVTALEFLPLHEFSRGSWGYNPSLFFSIDADYGGPQALARCVAAAHAAGKGVILDLVYNHLEQSPLQALAGDVYTDGETEWGAQVNYDHPAAMEFFRQATVYLWDTFGLDGFRFDSTQAIVNGQRQMAGVIKTPGSGGGWEFLNFLREALRGAADATGRRWPYCVGEHDPNYWPMTNNSAGGVLDGQWAFHTHYPLAEAAWDSRDTSRDVIDTLNVPHAWLRPFSEAVRYGESHDSCGHREDWKLRVVRRAPFGQGFQVAKAIGTVAIMAHGVPMLFMGQEGGEDNDFFFDYDPAHDRGDETFFARLGRYEDLGDGRNRIFAWFRDLIGLRNDLGNNLRGNGDQGVGRGFKTVAFTRAGGRFFVIATFGTPDTRQTLGWLGLPAGAAYKEVFNSSWPAYQVSNEGEYANGGYGAVLTGGSVVNVPPIGGIVLERR
jgi:1,4-alpha-glucan branching enzyme